MLDLKLIPSVFHPYFQNHPPDSYGCSGARPDRHI